MITRRNVLRASGVALLGGLAGCTESIPFLGDQPLEFAAGWATVPDATLQETGYEEHQRRDVTVERTFEVGGETQDVVVTNRQAEYDRAIDLAATPLPTDQRFQAAVFTALSTPQVDVLGRTFNPVADMSADELATMVQERYGGMSDLSRVGERTAPVAGQSTTVGAFDAEAELLAAGMSVELRLYVAEAVEVGEDLVVAVGAYPRTVHEAEESNVFAMMEAIEHGGQG